VGDYDRGTSGLVNFNDGLTNPTVTLNGVAGRVSHEYHFAADATCLRLQQRWWFFGVVGIMDFTGGTVITYRT
jgi:hypothetical protein